MSLLIKDATVVTVDKAHNIFAPGAVFIDGKRIVDVGPSQAVAGRHANAQRVIDGRGKVVAPGFVNLHAHVGNTVFRGRSEDAGFGCVTGQYFPMAAVISREERLAVGSLTYAELLRGGVTTVLEMEEDADIYAPFVERLGIRSAIGVMIHDVDLAGVVKGEFHHVASLSHTQLRQAIDFAERWHGKADGRITAMMTPNMTISSSPEQLRGARAAADRLGLRLSIHLGWGPDEDSIVRARRGTGTFEYARDNGLLASDVVVAHGYYTGETGLGLMAEARAHLAHCPLMNAVRGSIAPVKEYRAQGVNVGLGLDNMFSDYFEVLRAAVAVARIRAGHPTAILAPDALELATMGGAKALGMEREIGSLEAGKRADLIVLDYRAFGLAPVLDPVQTLVYHAHASDVETVLVDGRIVVEGGAVVGADERALVDGAEAAAASAWSRFVERFGVTWRTAS